MIKFKNIKNLLLVLAVSLIVTGCLVSGTFIVWVDFTLTTTPGNYYYKSVDLTQEDEWEDHKDDIDFVDAVGFEFYLTASAASTFDAWIDDPQPSPVDPPSTASKIINGLSVPQGVSTITYAQSLSVIQNLDRMKTLAKTGQFDFWGISSGAATIIIDSAKVIVTVSAGK